MNHRVAVVGSANLDIVLRVSRRPAAGETLLGDDSIETAGGKGANQALAAALVTSCTFVGAVGRDHAGTVLRDALTAAGVDTGHLAAVNQPTGRAYITVTPDGENSIVVLPHANHALTGSRATQALEAIDPALVLTQLEITDEAVGAVATWCLRSQTRLVVNASPVRTLDHYTLALADPVIVNAGEARALLVRAEGSDLRQLAAELTARARSVVLTAGADGAFVARQGEVHHVEGTAAEVRDTTGAGDAFAGTLAAHLAKGADLVDAARRANARAGVVVARHRDER